MCSRTLVQGGRCPTKPSNCLLLANLVSETQLYLVFLGLLLFPYKEVSSLALALTLRHGEWVPIFHQFRFRVVFGSPLDAAVPANYLLGIKIFLQIRQSDSLLLNAFCC